MASLTSLDDYGTDNRRPREHSSPQRQVQNESQQHPEHGPPQAARQDSAHENEDEDDDMTQVTASTQHGRATYRRKRQKISLACDECRSRKVRCDGLRPQCSSCRRKHGQGGPCSYPYQPAKKTSQKRVIQALHNRLADLECRLDGEKLPADSRAIEDSMEMDAIPTPLSAGMPSHTPAVVETLSIGQQSQPAGNFSFRPTTISSVRTDAVGQRDDGSDPVTDEEPGSTNAMGIPQTGETPEETTTTSPEFYGKSSASAFFSHIQGRLQHGQARDEQPQPSSGARRQPPRDRTAGHSQTAFSERSVQHMDDHHLPPRHVADHLLDLYWTRSHSLYPYIHWPTLMRAYERLWMTKAQIQASPPLDGVGLGGPNCSAAVFYCAINAIFAMGTQFAARSARERKKRARPFEHRARHLLHLDCLDRGDIALVQALLIMAHYLQCTNLPSRCWNLAGVAYRMAQGLGLHLEVNEGAVSPLTGEIRKRVWYGCVNLDVVLGMTHGRPCLNSRKSSVTLPAPLDEECTTPRSTDGLDHAASTTSFFVETSKLYKILDNILSQIYDPWKESEAGRGAEHDAAGSERERQVSRVLEFDAELNRFEACVPDLLHWSNEMPDQSEGDVLQRQRNVLRTRFLHTRILLYRPLFVQLCQKQQPGPNGSSSSTIPTTPGTLQVPRRVENGLSDLMAERCSISCVETAQALIEHIHSASKTADTGAPWFNSYYVYYSAMVLALVELCPPVRRQLDQARLGLSWQQCQDFQEDMAEHDPESYRYLRALKDISEYIKVNANADVTPNGNKVAPQINTMANERQGLIVNHITNPSLEPPMAPWFDGNSGVDLCPPFYDSDFGADLNRDQPSPYAVGNVLGGMGGEWGVGDFWNFSM